MHWSESKNGRKMPWKSESDPYRIWLSEIILQQTRVQQGLSYYEQFLRTFPNIESLAVAPDHLVLKQWEGLGYYARCKNLIRTARMISLNYGGKFPDSYLEIASLPGIGPYTAAAISSFAFGLPHAVLDGNVYRVLSRYFGINAPAQKASGKKLYSLLAQSLLKVGEPGVYNQAIMDFGAEICRPRRPLCQSCVQRSDCVAHLRGWVDQLPVKAAGPSKKQRWFYYFVVETLDNMVCLRERTGKDIWEGLYEFPMWESRQAATEKEIIGSPGLKELMGKNKFQVVGWSGVQTQQLSHQFIRAQFVRIRCNSLSASPNHFQIKAERLEDFPFPRVIKKHLQDPVYHISRQN